VSNYQLAQFARRKGPSPLRTHRVNLSLLILLVAVASAIGLVIGIAAAAPQKVDDTAVGIVRSWNEAVSTLEPEDQNFHELLDSYQRNPPGRVLLTADLRAEQRKRRLRLIAEIVASHERRIKAMTALAKYEEALP
jgi:hypothetical protein